MRDVDVPDLGEGRCVGYPGWTETPLSWQRQDCHECPVRAACLEFALRVETEEAREASEASGKSPESHLRGAARFGGAVYGGLTRAERAKILCGRLKVTPARIKSEPGTYESCGKPGGYQMHSRLGERSCGACRAAQREYQRDYRAAKAAKSA